MTKIPQPEIEAYHAGYQAGYENGKRDAVKHGEWIEDGWNVVCSSCGVGKWKGYVPGLQEAKEWMPRCPNCGAKMDGKEEE